MNQPRAEIVHVRVGFIAADTPLVLVSYPYACGEGGVYMRRMVHWCKDTRAVSPAAEIGLLPIVTKGVADTQPEDRAQAVGRGGSAGRWSGWRRVTSIIRPSRVWCSRSRRFCGTIRRGACSCSGASGMIFGTTVSMRACSQNGWSAAASYGPRRLTA